MPELETAAKGRLADLQILVAEDKYWCAHDISVILEGEGARVVGPFGSLRKSIASVASVPVLDFALVDMDLTDGFADSLAKALLERGVPYAVVTGYGPLPTSVFYDAVAIVQKPIVASELIAAIATHLDR